jgi:hypothetical protein
VDLCSLGILDFVLPEVNCPRHLCAVNVLSTGGGESIALLFWISVVDLFLVLVGSTVWILCKAGLHFCVVIPKQGCFQIGTYSWISLF